MKKVSEVSNLSKEVPFTDVFFSPHGVGTGGGTLEQRLEHNYALARSTS